ncbi:FAD-binding protein [Skermania sp. ID1734]|uniref:FAD-binding and (Fe-S)-binding domain-containing protein n=1 Tax=Skermania sp. ID1734 TaxID=2597516 RepID=UPI001180DC03|nr:FAD-binding and (Fe-S)-binding domain-containing protein [Skermania sp. ID1734]TSE01474.1 FAD-binding protein [Skermania sp. ID1734]
MARTRAVLDRGKLAVELAHAVSGEVRFDDGARALYANDASIYRQVPTGVVLPSTAEDVLDALRICHEHGAAVFARGCGTGLAGQTVNSAVVFDFSKHFNRILEIDPHRRIARVQPGVICDELRDAAKPFGLTFAPDPATHDRCTLGGMIGNNSCGTHSVFGGKTVDNVVSMDVVTVDGHRMTVGRTPPDALTALCSEPGRRGEIYRQLADLARRYADDIRARYPQIPRRVSGYNLDSLLPENGFDLAKALVGSESTCVFVLEATLRLLPEPKHRTLLVIGYPDAATAADHMSPLHDSSLTALECFDAGVLDNLGKHNLHIPGMDQLPDGQAWLLAEYGADDQRTVDEVARAAAGRITGPGHSKVFSDAEQQEQVWEVRRSTIEFTRIPGEHAGLAGWEDAAVAPEQLGDYIRDYCSLISRYGYHCVMFGHFGQGCMHNRLDLDLQTARGVANFRRFLDDAGDLVVKYGGSLSGEHGDGQLRANQLVKMFGPELVTAFDEFKRIWDPQSLMNPGKVVRPYRPDQNLATGPDYRPRRLQTHFAFPDDEKGFADATNRCFGIGKCRHTSGGVMCPSFMVTREERHSTRGRARLLFEMMGGHLADGPGWRDPHVKEALDLCLSCKGCKSDCPVGVDMATYKAEFLSHYYRRRLRPRSAYALGLIPTWARMAAHAPRLANAGLRTPGIAGALKSAAGIAPQRTPPRFAHTTFREWFSAHPTTHGDPVLLWTDTFTNFFEPEVAVAAVAVLESSGAAVRIPTKPLCCGRPLYDYGMLRTAKRWLRRTVAELAEAVSHGLPVVVLEPSCAAVFRDELTNLFPDDMDAQRLSKATVSLGEYLSGREYQPPPLHRRILLQTHCHDHAVLRPECDIALFEQMGLDIDHPDSGCCGMAGSFGYEAGERHAVSVAVGERVILPAVRSADPRTLVVANGFSCREQIGQLTDRGAIHLAQLLELAQRFGRDGPPGDLPERSCLDI